MNLNMKNIQHLRLRKLLADLFAKHAAALAKGDLERVSLFHKMLSGVERCCREVMKDTAAALACDEIMHHMFNMELAASRIRRKAA